MHNDPLLNQGQSDSEPGQRRGLGCSIPGVRCNLSEPLFLLTSSRVRAAYEGDAATKLLMVACLACDVLMGAKALRKVWWDC